ncbi:hypothetical protein BWQ92_11805 [Arthrobacter sp. QXT-31]|nr:hypothetical protein BWQ92_11805 [Arthrobacter sp. QXT-31]
MAATTLRTASLTGRNVMAGVFEVFVDADSQYRFRLMAPNGTVLAISAPFADKRAAAAGIADVRECAGTGLVTDLSPAAPEVQEASAAVPAPVPAQTLSAQTLPARSGHGRQGFGKKRTPAEASGTSSAAHWRPSAPAVPARWTGAA